MTINQVIQRVKTIVLAHKQVRNFYPGLIQDFLTDKTTKYASVFMQDRSGVISLGNRLVRVDYRLFFLDMVNVSGNAKANEKEVQSDMVSVAMDILAQMNRSEYSDWRIDSENNFQLLAETENDMIAGCYIDVSVSFLYTQNTCATPSDLMIIEGDGSSEAVNINDVRVYDKIYTADGSENKKITISEIQGKKILLIIRENNPIYKVSNNPDSSEYTWDYSDIHLGVETQTGERFLILYRQ